MNVTPASAWNGLIEEATKFCDLNRIGLHHGAVAVMKGLQASGMWQQRKKRILLHSRHWYPSLGAYVFTLLHEIGHAMRWNKPTDTRFEQKIDGELGKKLEFNFFEEVVSNDFALSIIGSRKLGVSEEIRQECIRVGTYLYDKAGKASWETECCPLLDDTVGEMKRRFETSIAKRRDVLAL